MSTGLYSGVSGLALGVGLYKGVPGLWGGASGLITGDGASLSLNFLTSNTLDPRVTFSRTTNATLVDSTGRVTYAPNNLVTNSEAFDNASWSKVRASISANATTGPNGTTTADKLVEDTSTGTHLIQMQGNLVSVTAGVSYTVSGYARVGERVSAAIQMGSDNGVFAGQTANFDFSTGVISGQSGTATFAMTSVGGGWYRWSITAAALVTGAPVIRFQLIGPAGAVSYTGDGTSGLFIWGAQVEAVTYQTLPSTYNSTSPPNLLGFTEEFDNAGWTKTGSTITANATTSPDGTVNADKLVENTAVSTQHRVQQAVTTVSGTRYTYTAYLKAGERTVVTMRAIGASTFAGCTINLTAGTISAITGTATITNAGNGWYRVSVTGTADSTTTTCYVNLTDGSSITYTGDGVSGAFLWGAQLSNSASVDPYVYNPGAAPTSTAYYGPRFDYNPVTLAPNGLLIEEQRVNLVFPANATTGWSASPGGSMTATANAATSPDGTSNATKIATGDTLNSGHIWYTTFTGAINTVYTGSAYLKAGEYTRAQISFANSGFASATRGALFDLSNGTIVATAASTTATITNAGNGWYRCTVTTTSDADGGAYVFDTSPKPASVTTIGGLYTPASVGLGGFLYGAQVEAGAFATSYIPTVASTVTRAADIASMTGTNFSSWYNQSEGTIIPQFVAITNGVGSTGGSAFPFVYEIDSSAASNSNHQLILSAGYGPGWNEGTSILGVSQVSFQDAMTLGNANVRKIAYAYRTNDFAGCANGGTVLTDTSGTLPSPDRMSIGSQNVSGSNVFTGYIRTLTYYPSRLSDAQLRALTA